MGLFSLFKKKSDETKVGNVEDFISLTRVYFQSVIATNLGITNIRFFYRVNPYDSLTLAAAYFFVSVSLSLRFVSFLANRTILYT
ncbi:hypothetical protein IMSAGC022_01457 [Alistipes sp.]|nr:hypothetical protein IMSAGC022_01457 [Alistipes sp.]